MRRTKIICTIGPKTCEFPELERLALAGMNVARLNMSHGDYEWHRSVIRHVRAINQRGIACVSIMLDTKGPEVRSGDLPEDIHLQKGEIFTFTVRRQTEYEPYCTDVNYDAFINDVTVGDVILIDGGLLSFKVVEKIEKDIRCEVIDEGTLGSRRHIHVKSKSATLPSITQKDWEDIQFGVEEGVDYFALSFIKDPSTIVELKEFLRKRNAHGDVIAKIESAEAIPKLAAILEVSDGTMVARGDLGAELPIEEVPIVQEDIIRICRGLGKPVIVATHMLESMINHPTPTRAEVTDITQAVLQGADATMLTGETAAGKYPFKVMEVMDRVARRMERRQQESPNGFHKGSGDPKYELARSASAMATNVGAAAMLVITRRGSMAAFLSQSRPRSPIFAFTNVSTVERKLTLYWGITPWHIEFSDDPEETIQRAIELLKEQRRLAEGDRIIVVSDMLAGDERIETIQVRTVS